MPKLTWKCRLLARKLLFKCKLKQVPNAPARIRSRKGLCGSRVMQLPKHYSQASNSCKVSHVKCHDAMQESKLDERRQRVSALMIAAARTSWHIVTLLAAAILSDKRSIFVKFWPVHLITHVDFSLFIALWSTNLWRHWSIWGQGEARLQNAPITLQELVCLVSWVAKKTDLNTKFKIIIK